MNFPIVFASLAAENQMTGMKLNRLEDGKLVTGHFGLQAETAPSFSLALQQVLGGQSALGDSNEQSLAEMAETLDLTLLQLLSAEEWSEEDWNALAEMIGSLLPLLQSTGQEQSVIAGWLKEQAPSFDRLANKLLEQQVDLSEMIKGRFATDVRVSENETKQAVQLNQTWLFERALQSQQAANPAAQAAPSESGVHQLMAVFNQVVTETIKQLTKNLSEEQLANLKSSDDLVGKLMMLSEEVSAAERLTSLQGVHRPLDYKLQLNHIQSAGSQLQMEQSATNVSNEQRIDRPQAIVVQEGFTTQHADTEVGTEPKPTLHQPVQVQAETVSFSAQMKDVGQQPAIVQGAAKSAAVQAHVNTLQDTVTNLLVQKWQTTQLNGVSEAKIKLFPEQLGHLDITIRLHNGQMVAQFVAESLAGKEMLESQLLQLRNSLQNQGIQVNKIEVLHQTEQHLFNQHEQPGQSNQQWTPKTSKGAGYELNYEEWYDDLEQDDAGEVRPLIHGGVFEASV